MTKHASAYSGSKRSIPFNGGLNGGFPTRNVPAIVRSATAESLSNESVSSAIEAVEQGMNFSMLCKATCEPWEGYEKLDRAFNQFFEKDEDIMRKWSLKELHAPSGLASPCSKPSFVQTGFVGSTTVGLAVFEYKATVYSPQEQLIPAFASGANILLSHLRAGLPIEECAVPLVLTNGNLYQFAWATLIEPSFPVLHVTTGVLDASLEENKTQIAKNLARVKIFCTAMQQKLQPLEFSQDVSEPLLKLNQDKYHTKELHNVFYRWDEDHNKSLGYMWKVFDKLSNVEEAVLPLCITTICYPKGYSAQLMIFPKLKEFRMGVPSDLALFQKFMKQMEEIMKKVHEAGVIHVDLYPSNILWLEDESGDLTIRIVDWDTATLMGDHFTPRMTKAGERPEYAPYYWTARGPVDPRFDYWFLFILNRMNQEERDRMNEINDPYTVKPTMCQVNDTYRDSVDRQREESDDLKAEFLTWYATLQ